MEFGDLKVLACDDSITNVFMLSNLIRKEHDVVVDSLTDPRKVIDQLESETYDLLLLDLEMPHLTGFEVMEQVRNKYCLDELPILILTGNQTVEVRHRALAEGANDFLTKPFEPFEVNLRVKNLLKVRRSYKSQKEINQQLEQLVQKRTTELNQATEDLVYALSVAGELHDNETGQHVLRVGKMAGILAEGVGLPTDLVYMIERAAQMHDVGKIAVPDCVLLNPGKLDAEEWILMKSHAESGAQLLGSNGSVLIQMARSIALSHHEKWDGTGYPKGLKGESIPIEGRITGIVDVFDALTSKRPYKDAWPVEQAVQYITDEAGKHFDPKLVEVFNKHLDCIVDVRKAHCDLRDVEEASLLGSL